MSKTGGCMRIDQKALENKRIFTLIDLIESKTGKMFHETHPELCQEHMSVMDGKSKAIHLISKLTKIIDSLN